MVHKTQKSWFAPALIVLGVLCLFIVANRQATSIDADTQTNTPGQDNIMVVPVEIERDNYGIAMVDVANQTIWIYEINTHGPTYNRLRLLAARSWKHDRLLKDLNNAEPKPEQIKLLLENEALQQIQGQDANAADVAEPNNTMPKQGSESKDF